MNIAYGNVYYNPDFINGAAAHIFQFINVASQLGHDVWCWPGDKHPASKKFPASYFKRLMKLREMDAILIRLEWDPPVLIHWSAGWRKKMIGDVKIVWEFNTIPEYGIYQGANDQGIAQAIRNFKKYSQGCDLAVCVSNGIAEYVKARFQIENVLAVTNGSDPDLFRPDIEPITRVSKDPNKINVTWIGSADIGWHDLDVLCEATNIIWGKENRKRFEFHIVGRGLQTMGSFPENVHYHGIVDYVNLPRWLSAMDVGLVLYKEGPADYGSPLKLYDYMASGLAIIGTEQPQLREIFSEMNQMDLMISHNNPEQLAEKIIYLEKHRDRIRRQGELGRKLILEKYNWKAIVSKIIRSIEELKTDTIS
jgi:glycosyltransferase involved in cell wall biosynthesis